MNPDTAVHACYVLFAALDNIAAHDSMPSSIWLEALKSWNAKHDKDTWAIPRKGTDYLAEVRKIMDALNAPAAPPPAESPAPKPTPPAMPAPPAAKPAMPAPPAAKPAMPAPPAAKPAMPAPPAAKPTPLSEKALKAQKVLTALMEKADATEAKVKEISEQPQGAVSNKRSVLGGMRKGLHTQKEKVVEAADALKAILEADGTLTEKQISKINAIKHKYKSTKGEQYWNAYQIKKARELVRERKKAFAEIKRATKGEPQGYAYENAKDQLYAAEHALAELLKAE